MTLSLVGRLFVCIALSLASSASMALPQWQPLPAGLAGKRVPPAHLAGLAALPAGSVTMLQASAAKSASAWELRLPDGSVYRLVGVQRIRHSNGDVTVSGTLDRAGALYPVLVTLGAEASFGTWNTPQGEFRLEAWGRQAWLIDTGHPALLLDTLADDFVPPPPRPRGAADVAQAAAAATNGKATAVTIDVLFLYSAGFAARYPGSAAQTRINHLLAVANQTLADSAVATVLRLVGSEPTHYTDGNGNSTALNDLRLALSGQAPAAGLAGLAQRRAALGADLVTLIRPHDIDLRGSCGIAYLYAGDAALGVNVVSDGNSSWSVCRDSTYVHEIGHNLGAEHQHGHNSPQAGFGKPHIVLGQFNTVMGSFGSGSQDRALQLFRFSNPQQLCGGRPCGRVNDTDNARRLRDNMGAVAAFAGARSAVPALVPTMQDPDSDADGVPDSRDAFPWDPRQHADRDFDGVADPLDRYPDDPTESADTDGDGVGDSLDPDRDDDSVANAQDAFPLDRLEWADSDGDGVGDNGDRFPLDRREWADSDGDGVGDHAEMDADADGIDDLAGDRYDLLVVSRGTDRVIRLDGADGLYGGIEINEPAAPVAFGPRGALAWNPHQQRLYALMTSEVRRYDRAGRRQQDTFLGTPQQTARPRLPSAFPAGFAIANDGTVFVADPVSGSLHRYDGIDGQAAPTGEFGQAGLFSSPARVLALSADGSRLWAGEQNGRLTELDAASGGVLRRVQPTVAGVGIGEPAALLLDADGHLIVAATDRVLRIDPARADAATVLVAAGNGGLQAPRGLAFGPDGRLYVSSQGSDAVLRYDPHDGAFVDVFSRTPPGALAAPGALLFVPKVADRLPTDPQRQYRPQAGPWFNPERSGHGIDLQAAGDQLALIWYTFERSGRPIWYQAAAPFLGREWQAELRRYRWDGASATSVVVGEVGLRFEDERRAEFRWTLDGESGREPMQWLQVATSSEPQFPTAAWYPPAASGWGLTVTRQGEIDAAIAYLYDRAGEPTWLLGVGQRDGSRLDYPMLRFDGPTRCPDCSGSAPPTTIEAGELRFAFSSLDRARVATRLQTAEIDWRFDDVAFERLTDTPTAVDGSPPR